MKSINPVEIIILIAAILLIIQGIRYQRRKRAEEVKQTQALFSDRISSHERNAPKDLGLLELAQRQLADWQNLLAEMETSKAPSEQIRYCRQQVARFQKEVAWLRRQAK